MSGTIANPIAIIGSTGLLGQALTTEAEKRGVHFVGIARKGAHYNFDAINSLMLRETLDKIKPKVVINAAAKVSLEGCEKDRGAAYLLNADLVATLADYCRVNTVKLCHVSTDHYYTGDGNSLHDERSPVVLLNEYARTKYAGECFALTNPSSLVLRTNIVGYRGWAGPPTFVEWAIGELVAAKQMTLFEDFYTSSIDVKAFAKSLFDLLQTNSCGLLNVAARECSSKLNFVLMLAERLKLQTSGCSVGSVRLLSGSPRAESLGLDVSYAESILGYSLPNTESVIESLAQDYEA